MKKLSVLIVDDSSVMRKIVGRALRQAGLEMERLLEAENGADALRAVQANPLDLILSDLNMPEMDGIELLRRLRDTASARDVPVLVISTDSSEQKVRVAISLGARGYIRKPFSANQLRQQVAELLVP